MAPAAEMGDRVKRFSIMALCVFALISAARATQAATYCVTVAGLGGEPDYEQRFTAMANDLDKIL